MLYVNQVYQRTDTLWEGRHKASAIDSESCLLVCYRYIQLNPVRAGLVASPGDCRWSSYRYHALAEPDPLIEDHPLYLAFGRAQSERCATYRALCKARLDPAHVRAVRRGGERRDTLGQRSIS